MTPTPEVEEPVDPLARVLAALRTRSRVDLFVYGVVAALIVVALVGPLLATIIDKRLILTAMYEKELPEDLWGTPWVHVDGVPRSLGPDQLDDDGKGDDLVLLPSKSVAMQLFRGGADALFGIAVVLAILWELFRALAGQLRSPRGSLLTEAGRAAILALAVAPFLLLLLAMGSHLLPNLDVEPIVADLRSRLLVPLELALFGTVYLLTAAVLLGVRLRAEDAPPST